MKTLFKAGMVFMLVYVLLASAAHAQSGYLYALRGVNSSTIQIVRINPVNGHFDTVMTRTGTGSSTAVTINPATRVAYFKAWENVPDTWRIFSVDLATGQLVDSPVCALQVANGDPAFNSSNGKLYANKGLSSSTQQYYKIDPLTGVQDTLATHTGFSGGTTALTLNTDSGYGYFAGFYPGEHRIFTINLSTGSLVRSPLANFSLSIGDPQYNRVDGKLYAMKGVSSSKQLLLRINPLTGAFDTIASLTGFAGGTTALTLNTEHNVCYFLGWDSAFQHRVYTVELSTGAVLNSPMTNAQYNTGDPVYLKNPATYVTEKINATLPFRVYPNPSVGKLHIVGEESRGAHFRLIDLMGNTVLKGELRADVSVADISELKAGIYIFQLMNESGTARSVRVVKE